MELFGQKGCTFFSKGGDIFNLDRQCSIDFHVDHVSLCSVYEPASSFMSSPEEYK
jgi:hypothetical protein